MRPALRRYVAPSAPAVAAETWPRRLRRAVRHLCLGGSRRNLRGWLVQVCYRSALRQRKRRARRDSREAPWEPHLVDGVSDAAANPEDELAAHRRQHRLQAVVRALPSRDRQCLYLRADGLPYRAIATTPASHWERRKSIARRSGAVQCVEEQEYTMSHTPSAIHETSCC